VGGEVVFLAPVTAPFNQRHAHRALALIQGFVEQPAQVGFVFRFDNKLAQRQIDVVFAVAVELRPVVGGLRLPVDPQNGMALAAGPLRQFFVDALAVDDKRRQQGDFPAAEAMQQMGEDGVAGLGLDGYLAFGAILDTELDEEQAQEVVDLGEGADSDLVAATAGALFDGDRGRDAEDRIHVGTRGRLHELTRVGIE
jgi:hypothetical protein